MRDFATASQNNAATGHIFQCPMPNAQCEDVAGQCQVAAVQWLHGSRQPAVNREAFMHCAHCASETQAELTAEINIHFAGLRNIDCPGILLFPTLVVCSKCGFSRFTMPEAELAMLAMCSPESDASTRTGDVRNPAIRRSTAARP
jgi:hypothetical protein